MTTLTLTLQIPDGSRCFIAIVPPPDSTYPVMREVIDTTGYEQPANDNSRALELERKRVA